MVYTICVINTSNSKEYGSIRTKKIYAVKANREYLIHHLNFRNMSVHWNQVIIPLTVTFPIMEAASLPISSNNLISPIIIRADSNNIIDFTTFVWCRKLLISLLSIFTI